MHDNIQNILIFCNQTPHRKQLLESVLKNYSGAIIIGVVSSGGTLEKSEKQYIDEEILLETKWIFRFLTNKNLWHLRKKQIDLLILPFDGFRYRLAVAIIKPAKCEAWTGYIQPVTIPVSTMASCLQLFISRVKGVKQLLRIAGTCVCVSFKHKIFHN